jgi:hypothetical protein
MMGGPENEEALMFLHHFVHDLDRFIPKVKRLKERNLPTQEKKP